MTQAKIDLKSWIALILMVVLVIGSFTWMSGDTNVDVTNVDNEALQLAVIAAIETSLITNATGIEDRLSGIEDTLNEDEAWENDAEALALEELEDNDYENLFDFLNDELSVFDVNGTLVTLEIDDENDIDEVVIKDVTITFADTDDKDAIVYFEMKVYYEDITGEDKKEYVDVTFGIEDEDVESTAFVLA